MSTSSIRHYVTWERLFNWSGLLVLLSLAFAWPAAFSMEPGQAQSGSLFLKAPHVRRHHGTGSVTGRIDEIGDPDVPVERSAVERLSRIGSKRKLRHLAEYGQRSGLQATGQDAEGENCRQPHAALRVAFCAAMAPETSRRTSPKTAVTVRLSKAPGAEFGSRSTALSSEIE